MEAHDFLQRVHLADSLGELPALDVVFELEVWIVGKGRVCKVERGKYQPLAKPGCNVKELFHMTEEPVEGKLSVKDKDGSPCIGLTPDSRKRKDASRFDKRLIPADPLFGMVLPSQ